MTKNVIRFLIGKRESFENQKRFTDIFDETSIHAKMNIIKQVVQNFEPTKETQETHLLFEKYVRLYDANGTLTDKEEYELMQKFGEYFIKWKSNKII